jgi:pimeloyl-ACP methyl ester carboxylesterase
VHEYYRTDRKVRKHMEGLARIRTIPTLVLHGTHDPFFPVEHGRELARLIPSARFVEYAGGHNLGNHESVFELIVAALVEHMTLHGSR